MPVVETIAGVSPTFLWLLFPCSKTVDFKVAISQAHQPEIWQVTRIRNDSKKARGIGSTSLGVLEDIGQFAISSRWFC